MSRPTGRDEEVIRAAALAAVDELREWLKGESHLYADDELVKILSDAIRYRSDGYERAKYLEDQSWSPDAALVELLEGIDTWDAERKAVAKWVKEFDVKPPFPIGTLVELEGAEGEITKHDETLGQATVFVKAFGHVREGCGTHGRLIAWEKLKPLATEKCFVE